MRIRWLTIFLDLPAAAFDDASAFWAEVTGSELSPPRRPAGEFASLLPECGDAYLQVQRIRAGEAGAHLDLHLDPGDQPLADAVARAEQLGATVLRWAEDLVLLGSPGGFTFCLTRWDGESRIPAPVTLDSGGGGRLDQLCLDIPAEGFDRECAFWAELTGWALTPTTPPEFAYLARPPGMPIRLLFQRRAVSAPEDLVTAHPDFASQDVDQLAKRQVVAGARLLARYPFWITLADPAGLAYCLTRRAPDPELTANQPPPVI